MHTNNPFMPFPKILILPTILLPVSRHFLIQGTTQGTQSQAHRKQPSKCASESQHGLATARRKSSKSADGIDKQKMMQEKRGKREASGSLSSTVLAKLSAPSQLAEYITSITSARGAQRGGRLKKKESSTDFSEGQSGRGESRTGKQRPAPRKTPRMKPNAGVWKPNGDGSVRLVERKAGSFSATRENRMTDLAVPEVLMSSRSGRKDKGTIPLIHVPLLELHELTLPESPEPLGKICSHIPRLITRMQETTDWTLTTRVLNHTLWLLLG
jgi:hypothetical protein